MKQFPSQVLRLYVSLVTLTALATYSTKAVDPQPLESKPLRWQVGDRKIVHNEIETPKRSWFDTLHVVSIDTNWSVRTIHWSNNTAERIVNGRFESNAWSPEWICSGKIPSPVGEVVASIRMAGGSPHFGTTTYSTLQIVTVSSDTTIAVPAGTFRCTVTRTRNKDDAPTSRQHGSQIRSWYSPGIGIVQTEHFETTLESDTISKVSLISRIQLQQM